MQWRDERPLHHSCTRQGKACFVEMKGACAADLHELNGTLVLQSDYRGIASYLYKYIDMRFDCRFKCYLCYTTHVRFRFMNGRDRFPSSISRNSFATVPIFNCATRRFPLPWIWSSRPFPMPNHIATSSSFGSFLRFDCIFNSTNLWNLVSKYRHSVSTRFCCLVDKSTGWMCLNGMIFFAGFPSHHNFHAVVKSTLGNWNVSGSMCNLDPHEYIGLEGKSDGNGVVLGGTAWGLRDTKHTLTMDGPPVVPEHANVATPFRMEWVPNSFFPLAWAWFRSVGGAKSLDNDLPNRS